MSLYLNSSTGLCVGTVKFRVDPNDFQAKWLDKKNSDLNGPKKLPYIFYRLNGLTL